jgi:hypothetical protein
MRRRGFIPLIAVILDSLRSLDLVLLLDIVFKFDILPLNLDILCTIEALSTAATLLGLPSLLCWGSS